MKRRWSWALLALVAAGPPADPDWPCRQRLVPTLAASSVWTGPAATGDWRSNPSVAAVIGRVAPRAVAEEDGVAQLKAFADGVPAHDRPLVLPLVVSGLMDETNAQRSQIIERLRDITRRQRDLTATETRVTAELRALPDDAPADQRQEVTTRRDFLIRNYEAVGRTIRYACEVPVQLEGRIGAYARVLQDALGG